MRIKKWQIITAVVALIIVALGAMWLSENNSDEVCSGRGENVSCVPDKKCTSPSDMSSTCQKLRQEANKTE